MHIKLVEHLHRPVIDVIAEIDIPDSRSGTKTTIFRQDYGIYKTTILPKWAVEAEKLRAISQIFEEFAKLTIRMGEHEYEGWKDIKF